MDVKLFVSDNAIDTTSSTVELCILQAACHTPPQTNKLYVRPATSVQYHPSILTLVQDNEINEAAANPALRPAYTRSIPTSSSVGQLPVRLLVTAT